ncbi:MAG: NAD(P)H-dependent oxidoreductase [Planctomycetes bacterium]|nr:NAD(P)H-dependent oxidoreductase [Planctomycetota bacterium]
MATVTPANLIEQLHWRYSTKRFDPARAIPPDVWEALEQSLVLAPSSFGLQPWKFLVVEDATLRTELRLLSWNQPQITDANKLVVFLGQRTTTAADVDRFLQRQCDVRGATMDSLAGYRRVIVNFVEQGWAAKDHAAWNARQVYIALGQFLCAAAMLGVDSCALEGVDTVAYDRLLGLDATRFTTLCVVAAGYRAAGDRNAGAPKVRYPANEIVERR